MFRYYYYVEIFLLLCGEKFFSKKIPVYAMLRCSVLFTYSLAFAASSAFQGLTSLFEIKKHSAESGRALYTHILLTKTKPS